MAQTIKLKNSGTSASVPQSSDLVIGEVALNYNDGKLFYENDAGAIKSFLSPDGADNYDIAMHDSGTKGLMLGGTLVTSSATEMNYLDGASPGTVVANVVLVSDGNLDIDFGTGGVTLTDLKFTQPASTPSVSDGAMYWDGTDYFLSY